MQYLTIIGLSLATTTFAVGLLADITMNNTLFQVKNALSVGSAPMECLISLLYWGLRAVNTLSDNLKSVGEALISAPDRSETRPPRLGTTSTLPHRSFVPCDPIDDSRHRPPFLLAAIYYHLPACLGSEYIHCIWLLVLDRKMLSVQQLLSVSSL